MNKQLSHEFVTNMLSYGAELDTSGMPNLLWNGAKAYYMGGGWWRFHWYSNVDEASLKGRLAQY